jgi:hypothetical protein
VPADAVVVVAPVQVAEAAQRRHNRHPRCRVSSSPGCKGHHFHHLDIDHRKTHHPICSNNTVTWCRGELGLVVTELALALVWVLDLEMELALAWALVLDLVLELVLGLEFQGNPHLHYKLLLGLCCIALRVLHRCRKSSHRPIYCNSKCLAPVRLEGQTRKHSRQTRFS